MFINVAIGGCILKMRFLWAPVIPYRMAPGSGPKSFIVRNRQPRGVSRCRVMSARCPPPEFVPGPTNNRIDVSPGMGTMI